MFLKHIELNLFLELIMTKYGVQKSFMGEILDSKFVKIFID